MAWDTQSDDGKTKVVVSGGSCRDGRERTDALIIDKIDNTKTHVSIGTGANDDVVVHHGEQKQK